MKENNWRKTFKQVSVMEEQGQEEQNKEKRYDIVLDESGGTHHYTVTVVGNETEKEHIEKKMRYPSVTTVLGKTKSDDAMLGLRTWRSRMGEQVAQYILDESSVLGTETHKLNEMYLLNLLPEDVNVALKGKYRLLSVAHHMNMREYLNLIDNVRGTEVLLFSEELKLAGTSDCIAEYAGVLSIIDFKTKRSVQKKGYMKDYFLQCCAYAMMWKERYGEDVEQCVIIVSTERGTQHAFVQRFDGQMCNELCERVCRYYGGMVKKEGEEGEEEACDRNNNNDDDDDDVVVNSSVAKETKKSPNKKIGDY